MPPKKPAAPTPVEAITHSDTRVNIPTEELRGFVAPDEESPKTLRWQRDTSLDPQLVWKGKDTQDVLEVPAVPIYIQEKVQPRAIIEELRRQSKRAPEPEQLNLFGDFNGIEWDQLVEFYQHEQNWSNRLILGDSLQVMASLAEKEGLRGKVQMIYIDPPYGIRFGSNWQVSTRRRDVRDGRAEDVTRQPEQIRAFRDTWELGVHSYLGHLRDRLVLARELLNDAGSIFVQIGDENVHLVRSLMDEVFGVGNFSSLIAFSKTSGLGTDRLPAKLDYLVWYAKDLHRVKYRQIYAAKDPFEIGGAQIWVELPDGTRRQFDPGDAHDSTVRTFAADNLSAMFTTPHLATPFVHGGRPYSPGPNRQWQTTQDGLARLALAERLMVTGQTLRYVRMTHDFPIIAVSNLWQDTGTGSFTETKIYAVQTGRKVVDRCLLMTTDPGDLVLDPTCGSGTTAYVAEQWGRRWITIDTSRVALALARTRIMSARYPYYLLSDSPEGARREAELAGVVPAQGPFEGDVRRGFVYRRVPHVTLKSIANNQEIDEIHARWGEQLEPLRAEINRLPGASMEEWELPREPGVGWPESAKTALAEWWRLRRERQKEIDASIARRADQELLYDQPYEDSKRVRVAGPFTVESLSPHRVLAADEELPAGEREAQRAPSAGQFELMVIENLRKAGVQNTVRGERMTFDRLEPFAGEWLQASGEYPGQDGSPRRVAVSIGPEHGTVGPDQVREAAKEAMRGAGFDLLVICGFAFDAHAGETANEFAPAAEPPREGFVTEQRRQYGKLTVLLARMNPDLAMGDLLKKTGAGNLFMVFGEPDIVIAELLPDGTERPRPSHGNPPPSLSGRSGTASPPATQNQPALPPPLSTSVERGPGGEARSLTVEIRGLDVYDPTTGEIRSHTTDDIACWFIDTDYNSESFFVRHAYFTGADEPYERLKRALKAEVDEEAWSRLYSTRSFPFPHPATGKIAVKVINHYGDEVLKVYDV